MLHFEELKPCFLSPFGLKLYLGVIFELSNRMVLFPGPYTSAQGRCTTCEKTHYFRLTLATVNFI